MQPYIRLKVIAIQAIIMDYNMTTNKCKSCKKLSTNHERAPKVSHDITPILQGGAMEEKIKAKK